MRSERAMGKKKKKSISRLAVGVGLEKIIKYDRGQFCRRCAQGRSPPSESGRPARNIEQCHSIEPRAGLPCRRMDRMVAPRSHWAPRAGAHSLAGGEMALPWALYYLARPPDAAHLVGQRGRHHPHWPKVVGCFHGRPLPHWWRGVAGDFGSLGLLPHWY